MSGRHHFQTTEVSVFKLSLTLASAPWGQILFSFFLSFVTEEVGSDGIEEMGKTSLKSKVYYLLVPEDWDRELEVAVLC